ncbi:DNA replication complex GINS family protein [Candidatus Bathyarchaeota archaeon]|nr:DNA replication complex GINS family protein [Candidatus Bathyarchaeota archaeon]
MYDELYQAWKREKENRKLQALPNEFYNAISLYIKGLTEEQRMLDERSLRTKLLAKELKYAQKLISDLLHLRSQKILQETLVEGAKLDGKLTLEEEALLANIASLIKARGKLTTAIVSGRQPELREVILAKPKKILVRFLREIPAIIGTDMKTYGPFKPEDVARLPVENVEALLKQGVVMKLEVEE